MIRNMRPKHLGRFKCQDKISDWTPVERQSVSDVVVRDHVATYPGAEFQVELDAHGNWHVYRKRVETVDSRLSEGVEDPQAPQKSKLLEQSRKLREINQANADFWKRRGDL